jgi:hypothetical protein
MNQDIVIKFYLKINPEVSKKNCLDALKIAKKKNIQNKMKRISSSFLKEKYWKLFYLIGFFSKDNFIYEHGVLHGYSLLSFAFGKFYSGSKKKSVIGQDLFEKYKFNGSKYLNLNNQIKNFKLNKIINLIKKNLMIKNDYKNNIFELKRINKPGIHMIDLSNCGTIIESAINKTNWRKVKFLIFEGGGSAERDNIKWMKRFKRKKIQPVLNLYRKKDFEIFTLKYYPTISVVKKKEI